MNISAPIDFARRECIATTPNPQREIDYLVVLEGTVRPRGAPAALFLTLRYVPDRVVADAGAWTNYLALLGRQAWPTLESLTANMLSDVNNEIVPRWLSIVVEDRAPGADTGKAHRVIMEDRQPKWENADLLLRVPRT